MSRVVRVGGAMSSVAGEPAWCSLGRVATADGRCCSLFIGVALPGALTPGRGATLAARCGFHGPATFSLPCFPGISLSQGYFCGPRKCFETHIQGCGAITLFQKCKAQRNNVTKVHRILFLFFKKYKHLPAGSVLN